MLVDIMDGSEVIRTYEIKDTNNPQVADAKAIEIAESQGLQFTHVRSRWETGETQTTLFD